MSGIEVAGLILGSFPILVTALEHYRESTKVLKNWWRFERAHNNFKYEVEYQQRRFEQNLEMYLLPLVTDDDSLLKLLLTNPDGPEWKDKHLGERLKKRIPENYDLYMRTIREMSTAMGQLSEKLRVGKSGYRYEVRRLIFCFDESTRIELLDRMGKYNDRLRELLDISDRITGLKRDQGVTRAFKGLLQFRHHANAVYSLLKRAWRCPCCHSHQANLLLKHRTNAEVDFSVLFLFGDSIDKPDSRPWIWQYTNIKLFKDARTAAVTLADPQHVSTVDHQTSGRTAQHSKDRNKSAKALSSAMKSPATSSPRSTSSIKRKVAVADPFINTTSSSGHLSEIIDLCSTIAGCQSTSHCLGLLKDNENQYSVFPILKPQAGADVQELTTLEAILSKTFPVTLTRRERYFIALALASSHLQLHTTPWLGCQWKKNDVFVIRDMNNPSQILIEQLYISRNFVPSSAGTLSAPVCGDFSFSTLGIMLLELCFGIPFESYTFRQQFALTSPSLQPILDHAVANQWCNSASAETGPEYAGAVRWCLDQTYSRKAQWRQDFVQEVIEPIRSCYSQLAFAGET